MVNEIHKTGNLRQKIIASLMEKSEPVSGERLASEFGVSRVAVWKQLKAIGHFGYRIEASARGYQLLAKPEDSLQPWDISGASGTVSHYDETDSTMNRALEAALSGAADGALFIAERQHDGRGTEGKTWDSAQGGLFFTVCLRPRLHPARYFRTVIAAQCALVDAIREASGQSAVAAWPNDILVPSKEAGGYGKAGGILCEHLCSGNGIKFLNIGIGLNTGSAPMPPGASRITANRRALLESFLANYRKCGPETRDLETRWASRSLGVGKKIEYRRHSSGSTGSGTFLGIDASGRALIGSRDGNGTKGFLPGNIHIMNKGTYR